MANRVYARFGVSAGAVVLPIVYLAGFGVWLVQFSFPTAAVVRFVQQVTQRGLSNASWSAFYNVVPADRRAQVLAFNDGVPGQLGTILSGLLLLAAGRILAPEQIFRLGAVTALVATIVVIGVRRRYGQSLVAALRGGAAERVLEGGPGRRRPAPRPVGRVGPASAALRRRRARRPRDGRDPARRRRRRRCPAGPAIRAALATTMRGSAWPPSGRWPARPAA